jgi:hypothetical protein
MNSIIEHKKWIECLESANGIEEEAYRLYARWKVLTDLFYFGYEILNWKETGKKGKYHRIDIKLHRWLCRILEMECDKGIFIPRFHLKTTWDNLRIAQKILKNPYRRIGLFSVTAHRAEQSLVWIKNIFRMEIVRRLFPDLVLEPGKYDRNWEKSTANELTIYRPDKNIIVDGPQIVAAGSGMKITGSHIDDAHLDDIIDKDTVTTPEQFKKSEIWWEYINAVTEISGETTIIGTFYHYNDLYNKIIRERQIHRKHIYIRRLIENGKYIYPTWMNKKREAKLRKRFRPYIFSCQFMLEPTPDEDKIFPPPQPVYQALPEDQYQYYIAVDPAATIEAYSDETGIVIVAKNKINQIFVVEAFGIKAKGDKIADILIQKTIQYKPVKIGIELGLQTHLLGIIESRKSAFEIANKIKINMKIEPIKISNRMKKGARINYVLGSFVRDGKCFINENLRNLIAEMDCFTGKGNEKDNLVDALCMIYQIIDSFAYRHWQENRREGPQTFKEIFDEANRQNSKFIYRRQFVA